MTNGQAILKKQYTCDQVEKLSIDTALQRNWTIPHRNIDVNVSGNNVTLTGNVFTRHAYKEAEKIARRIAGVFSVCNKIVITEPIGQKHAN